MSASPARCVRCVRTTDSRFLRRARNARSPSRIISAASSVAAQRFVRAAITKEDTSFTGELIAADDSGVTIGFDGTIVTVEYDDISQLKSCSRHTNRRAETSGKTK